MMFGEGCVESGVRRGMFANRGVCEEGFVKRGMRRGVFRE